MSKNTSTTPATPTTPATEAPAVVTFAFPSVTDYRNADVSGKAKIRRDVTAAMQAAIMAGDLTTAQAAMAASKSYSDAGSAPKADAFDWNAATESIVADLRHAADLLAAGTVTVTGAPDGFVYAPFIGPRPEGWTPNVDVDRATRFATVPVRRTGKRTLRDYLIAVTETIPSGTVTKVGDLAKMVGALVDDGYVPTPGAVSAALDSKKGIPGMTYIPANKAKGINAAGRRN
jgi:hypothetical protein